MFGHLRTEDAQLFAQLGHITDDIARSSALLERLLSGGHGATHDIGLERRSIAANERRSDEVDVHAFRGFTLRLDASEFRDLAIALDSAAEAVHESIARLAQLDDGDAPDGVRQLARTVSSAAAALHDAVPLAGGEQDVDARGGSDVQRFADVGETIYFRGVTALFAGRPDAMHVLRWKSIYEKLWHSLESCARAASVLDEVARANA